MRTGVVPRRPSYICNFSMIRLLYFDYQNKIEWELRWVSTLILVRDAGTIKEQGGADRFQGALLLIIDLRFLVGPWTFVRVGDPAVF